MNLPYLWPNERRIGRQRNSVAKGLLDKGYMAPTVYFPLVVPECMMFEPTETESKDTLDEFAKKFIEVLQGQRYFIMHPLPLRSEGLTKYMLLEI